MIRKAFSILSLKKLFLSSRSSRSNLSGSSRLSSLVSSLLRSFYLLANASLAVFATALAISLAAALAATDSCESNSYESDDHLVHCFSPFLLSIDI
jgi:hypothetical protein